MRMTREEPDGGASGLAPGAGCGSAMRSPWRWPAPCNGLTQKADTRTGRPYGATRKIYCRYVMDERAFGSLLEYLGKVPSIVGTIGHGADESGIWWVKFTIDIEHPLAWNVVQELGHVLNYVSIKERLPTVFYPVSPPPYLNGGPDEFLSPVIEAKDPDFQPGTAKKWLEGRLPQPVDDLESWNFE
jgi:hypothetical protein